MPTLRTRTIRLAYTQPELRPHLLPLLAKTAAVVFRKDRVTVPLAGGDPIPVEALVTGPWAIHKSIGGHTWTVTFTPTGHAITSRSKTLMDAKAFLEAALELAPELLHAHTLADVQQHSKLFVQLIKNPPTASGTSQKPPVERVSDKREKMKQELISMGLVSWGQRSGKAGELFAPRMSGRMGDTPTLSIFLGNREVLLNHYDLGEGQWRMWKSELISAMTPELLKKWVDTVKEAPTRGKLREEEENERIRARGEWLNTH